MMRAEIDRAVASDVVAVAVADRRPDALGVLHEIARQPDLEITALYETCEDTLRSLAGGLPDILLLDGRLPRSGLMPFLRRLDPPPHLHVVLLTEERDPETLVEALVLGVRGAVSRSASPALVLRCVRSVMAGDLWFSRSVTRALRDRIASEGSLVRRRFLAQVLTPRETDVVRRVTCGRTNQEIATDLGISHQTVRHHLKSVFGKLHVSSRLELALLAERDHL